MVLRHEQLLTDPGGTHMLRHMGMCCNLGRNPKTWVPFFMEKSLMGLLFKIFRGLLCEPREVLKICVFLRQNRTKWVPFFRKIYKYWYLF